MLLCYSTKKFQEQAFPDVLQIGCFCKFRKIQRKAPVQELLFDKAGALRPATFLKNRLQHSVFL